MKPITRKEYYLAKAAGTYTGPTPLPVLREDYYLATLAGDYSGNCPAPVTRIEKYMSAAAGLTTYVPQPVTRVEKYWYAIAKGAGYVPQPVTREERFLYALVPNKPGPPKPEYVDKTAEGSMILLDDSAEAPFTALTVYGHSTQDGTPSPENPVPIVSAGSVMTTGAQLFDENNTTTGYITDNFIVITNENWIISDFINCNENQNVCISQENNIYYQFRVCFYNSEKVATSIANYEAYVMLHVFSIPENAKYFKISYSVLIGDESVDRGKIMVNYGSTALPWEPYTGGIPGANPYEGEIGVEVLGGNLADISQVVNSGGSSYVQISDTGFSFTYSEKEDNTRLNQIPCKLKKGKQYICTAERSSDYITIYLPEIEQYLGFGTAFTPNEDVNYIVVYVNFGKPYDTYTVEHFMVNVGDTALSWEPYKTPQTLTLSTPGGLPGIPVTSGGNYTDADGQQWVCDEIDLARGKYVQRIHEETVSKFSFINNIGAVDRFYGSLSVQLRGGRFFTGFSNKAPWSFNNADELHFCWDDNSESMMFFAPVGIDAVNLEVNIMGILTTPIETDLPAEEIASYKALHTYNPTTTVSNDAEARMKVGYKATS